MVENPRVRYAPSPTGEPHIGNMRTALFNWLFARRYGGKFVVRVEDTDQERFEPGAQQAMLEGLKWLGIDYDEGPGVGGPYEPYLQSQRLHHYQAAADRMVDQGLAYRCYCSTERLEQMRADQAVRKAFPGYDGRCRDLTGAQREELDAQGGPSVIRFAMPRSGTTSVEDLIRGRVEWRNELFNDFIIIKSDGFPTYHLAVVVDDHLMNISHVLRAEEWLPSTPRHLQLYEALGYSPPRFGHLPMILGPDRDKLSKRHGATSILEYRDMGYLPEAMVNFMVLLGWSLDDKTEVMSQQMLVDNFNLERVSLGGAIFDQEKLAWMNGVYIRDLPPEELAARVAPYLEADLEKNLSCFKPPVDRDLLLAVAPLIQQRIKLLSEVWERGAFFFQEQVDYEPGATLIQKGMDGDTAMWALERTLGDFGYIKDFHHESLEESLRKLAGDLGLSPRQFFGTLRVAVTGRNATPPLFETMEVLGREIVIRRLNDAQERLAAMQGDA